MTFDPNNGLPEPRRYPQIPNDRHMKDRERQQLLRRIGELEESLAKEKGGWDAFYKLRKSVGEDRHPGMTAKVTTGNPRDVEK